MSQKIIDLIDQNPDLKGNKALLESIPGIGGKAAAWFLAYLGTGQRFSRGKQAAAFAGLTTRPWQSGNSVNGKSRICKVGHSELRQALFMPTLSTYGKNKAYKGLKESGKAPKKIVVGLKSQTLFNPALHAK